MKKHLRIHIIFLICITFLTSCQKDFLDKKPDKALLVPVTLSDFDALLDYDQVMNKVPELGLISSDDYYMTDDGLTALALAYERNAYSWASDVYESSANIDDWTIPYQQVFYSNIVLDGLTKITPNASNQETYNRIKGGALFSRAFAFYNLAQCFAVPYNAATVSNDLGIPIRLDPDVNSKSVRGNLAQTYDQIVNDLKDAEALLPVAATFKSRPSKTATQALLSRVFLTMGAYEQAGIYASRCLQANGKLINFNTLDTLSAAPLPKSLPNGNDEVLYYGRVLGLFSTSASAIVDSALYKSYNANDLRKPVFFNNRGKGVINFKGSYNGNTIVFGGIATDEIYLIRAECYARQGDKDKALLDLNTLLQNRWKTGRFVQLTAINSDDALQKILLERRKELISRGTRWTDLRRLNLNPSLAVTLSRIIKGVAYFLPPNDKKYVFAIPQGEINGSGIEQNQR